MAKRKTPPPRRNRLKSVFLLVLIGSLAFWVFRLHRENHRLNDLLREARHQLEKKPTTAAAPTPTKAIDPQVSAHIQDQRDAIEALSTRLREAGFLDITGLLRAVADQKEVVASLRRAAREPAEAQHQAAPASAAKPGSQKRPPKDRLRVEVERLRGLERQLASAKKATVDPEARRVQQELEKRMTLLRNLETGRSN